MSDIRNVAILDGYDYVVDVVTKETERAAGSKAIQTNTLGDLIVSFDKICEQDYVLVGNKFSIDYKFCNNNPYIEVYSSTNINGSINTTTGTFNVDLTATNGKLPPNTCITVSIVFTVLEAPANPILFGTEATATYVAGSSPETLTSICGTTIVDPSLLLEKTSNPSGVVYSGQTITYTITLDNTGNTTKTINANNFKDTVPISMLENITLIAPLVPGVVYNSPVITNTQDIVILPGETVEIKYTADVK